MPNKAASTARAGGKASNGSYFPQRDPSQDRASTPVLSSSSEDENEDTLRSTFVAKALPSPLDAENYINSLQSLRSSRAASVYSLSRISLSSQLSQLTSLALPDPGTLAPGISAIPTAVAAAATLNSAAEQIKKWLQKATEVLDGLDAEDDVEWAAAGGREGLSDVDEAIGKFEGLITVYVTSIEELQEREDVSNVSPDQLNGQVDQMEVILRDWDGVKSSLKEIKSQVELAMEWEELWNNVLGDINLELENLSRLVFEMEEARHRAVETSFDANGGLDMQELDTIIEETSIPSTRRPGPNGLRISLDDQPSSPLSPSMGIPQDDSRLLALFARMQPLRASLDFLPMTLSSFQIRAGKILPSACQELSNRRSTLEKRWAILENDAQGLRQELGEDRWVLVFRNAGRQAQKLCESVERSLSKLQEAIDVGTQHGNPPLLAKKVEAYETKKNHYGPAIRKVLGIIEKGVTDRQTVNGEILRVHSESKSRWQDLESDMKNMDLALDDLNMNRNHQLRDSISSIMSMDRSATGSIVETPGSSPASSVIMAASGGSKRDQSPNVNGSSHRASLNLAGASRPNGARRHLSMPPNPTPPTNGHSKKIPVSRSFSSEVTSRNASPSPYATTPSTATPGSRFSRQSQRPDTRPRWNSSSRVENLDYSSKPRPYPYASPSLTRKHSNSGLRSTSTPNQTNIPMPSPLGRSSPTVGSSQAALAHRPRHSTGLPSSLGSRRSSAVTTPSTNKTPPTSSHSAKQSIGQVSAASSSPKEPDSPSVRPRPFTAMSSSRRVSLLPVPKNPTNSPLGATNGRESVAGSRTQGHGRLSSLGRV